jgi:hypothetical protein
MLAALKITADTNNINLLSIAASGFCLFFSNYNMLTLKMVDRLIEHQGQFLIRAQRRAF